MEDVLDIVTNDCIRQLRQRCRRLGLEVGVVQLHARVQLHIEIRVILSLGLISRGSVPPVEHSMRYLGAQFSFPDFGALFLVVAKLPFPRRMEYHAADYAYQDQPDSSQYDVCPCAQAGETSSECLIARRRQEMQCAVGKGLEIESSGICIFFLGFSILHVGRVRSIVRRRVMVFLGYEVARARGSWNGVAHGGCMRANMRVCSAR